MSVGDIDIEAQKGEVIEKTFTISNTGTGTILASSIQFQYDNNDFEDDDDDYITLEFLDLADIPQGNSITAKVRATVDDRMDSGSYDDTVTIVAGANSDTFNLEIFVLPELCEDGKVGDLDIKLIPLFHPAAIIYNRSLLDRWNEDMEIVKGEISQSTLI